MKGEKTSIKWKLFVYMLAFVAATLVLLWLFQIVFLDSFYRQIKINEVKDTAEEIIEQMKKGALAQDIGELAHENNLCVRIVDKEGNDIYSVNHVYSCVIHQFEQEDILRLQDQINDSGGDLLLFSEVNDFLQKPKNRRRTGRAYAQSQENALREKLPGTKKYMAKKVFSLMYGCAAVQKDGTGATVLLNTIVTPMGATANILKVELFYIMAILLFFSGLLSYVMYKKVSRPIMQLNQKARQLAWGHFGSGDVKGGYREIAQLNETLNYAAAELSRTEAMRRELMANVSHDLRTPLTMITGYAEMMRDIPEENTPENVQVIIEEAKRLTRLVNDILDVSKLQTGNMVLNSSRFNLTDCIAALLENYTQLIKKDGYSITFERNGSAYVYGDEGKISQVLYNLLNNAVNYTGKEKKVLVRQSVSEGKVRISCIDFGEGIEEEEKNYIWDRYYKSKKAHKKQVVGSGLGLSIVKNILELHGAAFGVESEPGKGSNFWFELELSDEERGPRSLKAADQCGKQEKQGNHAEP